MADFIAYGLTSPAGAFAPVTAADQLGAASGGDLVVRASEILRVNAGAGSLFADGLTTTIVVGGGVSNTLITLGGSGITTDFPSGSIVDFSGALVTGLITTGGGHTFVNIGAATTAVSSGDLAASDGIRTFVWNASTMSMNASSTTNGNTFGINVGIDDGNTNPFLLSTVSRTGPFNTGEIRLITGDTAGAVSFAGQIDLKAGTSAGGAAFNGTVRMFTNGVIQLIAPGTGGIQIGPVTTATAIGDLAVGDGTREMLYDTSVNALTLNGAAATIDSDGTLTIGGSTATALNLGAGASHWQINSSGHFVAVTDASYDIGQLGALRPRNAYFSAALVVGTSGSFGTSVTVGSGLGTISCPGAGISSQRFGLGSFASGNNSTALGASASCSTNLRGTAVGNLATCTGTQSVSIGWNSTAAGNGVTVGALASSGSKGIAIGYNSAAVGFGAISIGPEGGNAAANQCAFGGNAIFSFVDELIFGSGATHDTVYGGALKTIHPTDYSGTLNNIPGFDLGLRPGNGTGNLTGQLIIQTYDAKASGAIFHDTLVTRLLIDHAAIVIGSGAEAMTISGDVVTIDSLTTGALGIGTNANAKTVTLGNTTGATGIVYNAGTAGHLFTGNMGFFGGAAVAQQTNIVSLTDSSGGLANDIIAAITNAANAGSADVGPTADAIADLAAKVNGILTILNNLSLMA